MRAFQSTPPVRGATPILPPFVPVLLYFNPRPPCGGRRSPYWRVVTSFTFQSTPPVRGATKKDLIKPVRFRISIHAPRAGGDQVCNIPVLSALISIHAPRAGGDISCVIRCKFIRSFQSTPPVRGATLNYTLTHSWAGFQSTPPVRGATSTGKYIISQGIYFNPRPPCGGRRPKEAYISPVRMSFQSTPPVRGATPI